MNVRLQIDRLVLEGVSISPGQRPLLQAAIEAELSRLLTSGGIAPHLASGGALPRVSAPGIQLTRASSPARLGQQIARSVYGGIGK
jgi:hypothetical protein